MIPRPGFRTIRMAVIVTVLLCTVGGGAVWWMQTAQPRRDRQARLELQIDRLASSNDAGRRTLGTLGLEKIEELKASLEAQAARVSRLVPSSALADRLDAEIAARAQQAGVTLQGFRPTPSAGEFGFETRSYEFVVVGPYHDVGAFLTTLLSLDRVTHIRNAKFEAVPMSDDESRWGIAATVSLVAFYSPGAPLASDMPSASSSSSSNQGEPDA